MDSNHGRRQFLFLAGSPIVAGFLGLNVPSASAQDSIQNQRAYSSPNLADDRINYFDQIIANYYKSMEVGKGINEETALSNLEKGIMFEIGEHKFRFRISKSKLLDLIADDFYMTDLEIKGVNDFGFADYQSVDELGEPKRDSIAHSIPYFNTEQGRRIINGFEVAVLKVIAESFGGISRASIVGYERSRRTLNAFLKTS